MNQPDLDGASGNPAMHPASRGGAADRREAGEADRHEQGEGHARPSPGESFGQGGWQGAVARTVAGMGYDVVDIDRSAGRLLRVTIDRLTGRTYPTGASESVTIEDCEAVTHQLQYALEVDGVDYARLEVSSPGLDRPLRSEADFRRFAGQAVDVTLRAALQGRKRFRGLLEARDGGWRLLLDDTLGQKLDTRRRTPRKVGETVVQTLDFELNELREARLVPVVNFKGRPAEKVADEAGGLKP